jgi:3',5'-cyclic AMP phosphodiesterase CpdA
MSLTLAVTADLHWGHRKGVEANEHLAAWVRAHPPDVLVLAGDVGSGENFAECLAQFQELPGQKCLVPGNHDIWVPHETAEDSLNRYTQTLPELSRQHGFHYLDHGPLYFPEEDLALVGTMNWYDYTWSLDRLRSDYPGEEHRLQSKRFTRGRHNDANFVRWPLDDVRFTTQVVAAFEQQLRQALQRVGRVIVVTHHPPLYGLGFPRDVDDLDTCLWDAFSGNKALEDLLTEHADQIALVFCGHTHRARECQVGNMRGYNIGGDYHFKRLLWLEWPAGILTPHEFT